MTPKVFVSHASEDKERFVLDFATKLLAKGIDTWLDRWEMLPGDSIVDKIFEEGIKNAQAIIVVLSNNSVHKHWVREELNAAFVKKVNQNSKLIPVVIDDCQVPEALQSTVWEKIKDLNNYETELERIVRAIYGHIEKPPIGESPVYAQTVIDIIPGLEDIDSLALKLACKQVIESKSLLVNAKAIWEEVKLFDFHEDGYFESLEILHSRGYIKGHKVADGTNRINRFLVTNFGFDQYARVYLDDYDSVFDAVAYQVVNNEKSNSLTIAANLSQPIMIINHILNVLESNGLVRLRRTVNRENRIDVAAVLPELRRRLRE